MKQWKDRRLRIAVLCGGKSTEHKISLRSSINIVRFIDQKKYHLSLIGVDKNGRWMLCDKENYLLNSEDPSTICLAPARCYLAVVPGSKNQEAQLINVSDGQPLPFIDVVFSVLHGASGEDGSAQGLLKILNIPYASSGVLGSAVCMDKQMTKRILRDAGIPVTPSLTLLCTDNKTIPDFDLIVSELGLPFFIKPVSQGSSIGVSEVVDRSTFYSAVTLALHYDEKVLAEKAIIGREIEIAVLGNNVPEVSVCGEIFTDNKFYSYEKKYLKSAHEKLIIPASLTDTISSSIRKMAQKAYLVLGCSVMARVGFFLTKQGEILVNEVNTLPGFDAMSIYPRLWKASGVNISVLLERLIMLALKRT